MPDVYLFSLASQRIGYLSSRQTLIAQNVANANTPGFRALDLKPFESVLDSTATAMATTDPAHLTPSVQEVAAPVAREDSSDDATVSGNSVEVEGEMMKLGEVNRDFSEATGIKKTFHQMFMEAIK